MVARVGTLIEALHTELLAVHAKVVVIDLVLLEFMNAAGINVFVRWLDAVHAIPPERQYKLRFAINTASLWQRSTLASLTRFAPDLISVA